MARIARERLAELLGDLVDPPESSTYLKLFMSDLSITVQGVGPLRFPVPDEQVARLRKLGHQARFGRGEETLTDPAVRDTWEIPKELVSIEWTEAFDDALAVIRDELGLPSHCTLTPTCTRCSCTRPASSSSRTRTPKRTTPWSGRWS